MKTKNNYMLMLCLVAISAVSYNVSAETYKMLFNKTEKPFVATSEPIVETPAAVPVSGVEYVVSQSSVDVHQGSYLTLTDNDGSTRGTTQLISVDPFISVTFPNPVTVNSVYLKGDLWDVWYAAIKVEYRLNDGDWTLLTVTPAGFVDTNFNFGGATNITELKLSPNSNASNSRLNFYEIQLN